MAARRFLVVLAHPLPESFAASAAKTVVEALKSKGHEVDLLDLYAEDFDPRLTAADGLVLVFPQWWFNLPAIMKGFIDRIFVPGVAFEHDKAGGRIVPLMTHIRTFWVVTSTGSPWWVVYLYMGNPVRRILKRGVAAFCAKGVSFRMLAIHDMDRATDDKRKGFLAKVRAAFATL